MKLNQVSHAAWNSSSINPISQAQQGGGATGVSKVLQDLINVGLKYSTLFFRLFSKMVFDFVPKQKIYPFLNLS